LKARELTIGPAEKPARPLLCADTDLSDLFDISQVPEKRRHIYVYSLLVLYTLLVHTLRDFHGSGSTSRQSLMTSEVTRLIEADAVAKNLY
jgi:hypothetical protein